MRDLSAGPARPSQAAARIDGGAARAAGAPRQDRAPDRAQHGGRGVLGLCAARRRRPGALRHRGPEAERRPPGAAEAGRGPGRHHRRLGPAAQPVRRAGAPRLPPTCRRPAKRSTTPSSACRSCGPAARSACSSSRTARSRTYPEDEVEALQTIAMVLAEMVAAGELEELAKPGRWSSTCRRPVTLDGPSFGDGVGLGYVVLHEPRVVVTNLLAEDAEQSCAGSTTALGEPARLDRRHAGAPATSPSTASTARCSRPTACSPTTAAGCAGCEEAIRNGLTAEAAVERVQSDTRARMVRRDRPVPARAAARPRRPRQPAAAAADRRRRDSVGGELPERRDPRRPQHGRGRTARLRPHASVRGLVLEEGAVDEPRGDRRARAGHSGRRPGRRASWRCRRTATRSSSTARRRGAPAPRAGRRSAPTRTRCGSEPAGRRSIARCAKSAGHPRRQGGSTLQMNAGLLVDLPHLHESGRRGHRPVPHRAAIHDRLEHAAAEEQEALLPQRAEAGGRAAGDVPHPRHRRRQGAALFPQHRRRRTRRWAGGRSACRSTGRACCAPSCAPCCGRPPATNCG